MIIVELNGRMGNQMFQYALGLSVSIFRNSKFSLFVDKKKNKFELGCFVLNKNSKQSNFLINLTFKLNYFIYRIFKKYNYSHVNSFFKEESFEYNPFIFSKPFLFYSGYFQSEKYFKNHSNIIRECFKFKENAIVMPIDFLNNIKNSNSISIHIRRGDYVTCKETNKIHGVLDLEYYYKAIEYISNRVNNPHFFIFSDEPNWVKENFKIDFPFYLSENNSPETDLYLITNCKHNIVANSSFSWWGAWLNINQNKIVCAPENWVQNQKFNLKDLVPKDWVKISNSFT